MDEGTLSSRTIRDLTDEELKERENRHLLGLKAVFLEQERRQQARSSTINEAATPEMVPAASQA